MLCEIPILFVSFAAFVALERLHPRVLHHVATQVTRVYASIIALVTLEWLFSSMHPHHVLFHITSVNSRMLWEQVLLRVSIATFVALERLHELYDPISGKEKCASSYLF